MSWLDKLFDWFFPAETTDPNCPHCRGLGYDASGYSCTCIGDKK